ncbi:BTB/POZ domain-containing protein KCTD5 [Aphelenchoides avenae]|nr:BTB/POZ domain-containing protein KCTD5 [Aphelenchus avenae]
MAANRNTNEWIQLNARGRIFAVEKQACLREPTSLFARLCDPNNNHPKDSFGAYLIECNDLDRLQIILDYLRTGQFEGDLVEDGQEVEIEIGNIQINQTIPVSCAGPWLEQARYYGLEKLEKIIKDRTRCSIL